ncbi:chromate efflux transporter [Pleionea mediterranea]|uniref:Chromate transporter n=1 Tax=Pleionea mediterranea TaxID=523701 RepID=A0A316FHN2_9GAMM|nr:chromate efflux transporter [Pleionea mediterranea]PWK47320.1 chromate transporter [Pleionea mediterranea]
MKALEIFWRFLLLGCVSFGGPAAHIGYFNRVFVHQLKWLSQQEYGNLVALSQVLPGPGSSQVGFALGLSRGGIAGGIAAFFGFTLPSFLLMFLLAAYPVSSDNVILSGIVSGLKLLAVVVVTDAIITMSKSFCNTRSLMAITIATTAALLTFPHLWTQIVILVLSALIGASYFKSSVSNSKSTTAKVSSKLSRSAFTALLLFVALFILAIVSRNYATEWPLLDMTARFYHSGSLVFGGGHVVLPLLQQSFSEVISSDQFLLGYAAAQGVPGPMFSLATYLGAVVEPENAFVSATLATLAIFLPGFLLVLGLRKRWQYWAEKPAIAGAIAAINAAVVGLLMSALYNPVFVNAVSYGQDMAAVIVGFFLLSRLKLPVMYLVFGFIAFGVMSALIGI